MISLYLDWNFDGAEVEYRRALESDPKNPYALAEYVDLLRVKARHHEALGMLRKARTASPALPVLAAKEAYALDGQADGEALLACRESQRDFLREHLGRWAPAFARMLMTRTGPGPLSAFAALLRAFVESDCARFGVAAGADHLVVRQADDEAERLCEGCGLQKGPPGVVAEA